MPGRNSGSRHPMPVLHSACVAGTPQAHCLSVLIFQGLLLIRNCFVASLLLFASADALSQTPGRQPGGVVPQTNHAARPASERAIDAEFLAVPDPVLARQHLRVLTSAPHVAGSPQDYATAQYVAEKFKAAGLQTEIVPYKVLISSPVSISVEAFDSNGNKI